MTLLLDDISVLETAGDPAVVDVRGLSHDSRRVVAGDLFCCLPGQGTDGHRFAADAVGRGAVALLCEHLLDLPVAQVRVAEGQARPAMARAAAAFWGFPSRDLLMAGITGTNGKTSVAHLLGAVVGQSGRPTTVLGTLSGARTTPEATDLQRRLAEIRAAVPSGTQGAVAMEVSSHALVQSRVDGIHFDVAVFTNLSHDHLDYHGSMEEYFQAKASLFTADRTVRGVVNAEDPWGRRLLAEARVPLVAVRADAASRVDLALGRSSFTWRGHRVDLAMTGAVNVHNAVLAAEAAVSLGLTPAEAAAGLAAAGPVPGRLEVVASDGLSVLVDYAHTPDGLAVVLAEARRLAGDGRVLVVFGCGGDRDRAKRPLMGEVATRLADRAYLTSDNPRREDPGAIIDQVVAGVGDAVDTGRLVVDADRRSAIAAALADARPGDVVVVAGKGHEGVQVIGDRQLPFDDRVVVADLLSGRGHPAA